MSFEFRDTDVYKLSKVFYTDIKGKLKEEGADRFITDQLRRASLSISLNIAEGYGRFHKADKRNFYVTAILPPVKNSPKYRESLGGYATEFL